MSTWGSHLSQKITLRTPIAPYLPHGIEDLCWKTLKNMSQDTFQHLVRYCSHANIIMGNKYMYPTYLDHVPATGVNLGWNTFFYSWPKKLSKCAITSMPANGRTLFLAQNFLPKHLFLPLRISHVQTDLFGWNLPVTFWQFKVTIILMSTQSVDHHQTAIAASTTNDHEKAQNCQLGMVPCCII